MSSNINCVKGNIVNVFTKEIYPAKVFFRKGIIKCVEPIEEELNGFLLPGFIDSHVHVESSMLCPSRFAEAVVCHGTTAIVTDPHEIANVLGLKGVYYMFKDAAKAPLRFFFCAPSCVPATPYETSGAKLGAREVEELLKDERVVALAEVMNFPGVITGNEELLRKIEVAKGLGKAVDGHCPLLTGKDLCKYIEAGVSTDHECTIKSEAREKERLGMKIMLREGASAKNMENLIEIAKKTPERCFLVSDDLQPEDLLKGHVDHLLRKAVSLGVDPVEAIRMVTLNPATHYGLPCGAIAPSKLADFVEVTDLKGFQVLNVWVNGKKVVVNGKTMFRVRPRKLESTFRVKEKRASDLSIKSRNSFERVRVIEVMETELLTNEFEATLKVVGGFVKADIEQDVLHISIVERYGHGNVANGFVKGFGLKKGAMASSVAHDSHNIVAVGTTPENLLIAVNTVIKHQGGICVYDEKQTHVLPLSIAGLMSTEPAHVVAKKHKNLINHARKIGCKLPSPFSTLSFMTLLVIPNLKISDRGLFDSKNFKFVSVIKNGE